MKREEVRNVVERWVQAWAKTDWEGPDAVDVVFADPVVDHASFTAQGEEVTRAEFARRLHKLVGTLTEARFEQHDILIDGDRALVTWSLDTVLGAPWLGVGAAGQHLRLPGANIFRVRDGRICERWSIVDARSLLSQGGLSTG
jgi:predicted ester cyclase